MGEAALTVTRSRSSVVGAVLAVGLRVALLGGAALAAYLLLTLLDGAAHADDGGAETDPGIAGISQSVAMPVREVVSAVRVPAGAPADRVVGDEKASQGSQRDKRSRGSQRDKAARGSLKDTAREVVRVPKQVIRQVPQPPRLVRPIVDDASGAVRAVVTSVRGTVSDVLPDNPTPPRLPLPAPAVDDKATSDDPVTGQVTDMLSGPPAPSDTLQEPSPLPPAPPPVAAAPSVGPPATWSPVVDVAVTPPPAPLIGPAETRSGGAPDRDPVAFPEGASSGRTVGGGDPPGGFALAGRPQWAPEITRGASLARPGDSRNGRPGDAVPPPPR